VAIVALVAALAGTAIAAGGLTKQQEKQVTKIAKKFAGADGAAGPQGSAGPQGPAGPSGAAGGIGKEGPVGAVGKEGPQGPPGPFIETLPAGTTETGMWSWGPFEDAETYPGLNIFVPIALSFPIPLEAEMAGTQAHLILPNGKELTSLAGTEVDSTACFGSVNEPSAEPGNLCVYLAVGNLFTVANPTGTLNINPSGAWVQNSTEENKIGTTGVDLQIQVRGDGAVARGTWAVTAEE
jgi:hypothetical protein